MIAVANVINGHIQNLMSFFNISASYLKKRNPLISALSNMLRSLYTFLSMGKRLRAMKYQVQLMHYRMHQMEKLIQENNTTNAFGGNVLNKYR